MRMIDGKPEYKNGLVSNDHVTLWCFLTADFGDKINSVKISFPLHCCLTLFFDLFAVYVSAL